MASLEFLPRDKPVLGYDLNRVINALNGSRDGLITINATGKGVVADPDGIRAYDSGHNITFNLNAATGSVTLKGDLTVGSTITGASIIGGTIAIGSGNAIFKADANGIYLGNATFALAPFQVTPAGAVTATSFQLLDGTNAVIADNTGLLQVTSLASSSGSPFQNIGPTLGQVVITGSAVNVSNSRSVGYLAIGYVTGVRTDAANGTIMMGVGLLLDGGFVGQTAQLWGTNNVPLGFSIVPQVTVPVSYFTSLSGNHTFEISAGFTAGTFQILSFVLYVIQFGK